MAEALSVEYAEQSWSEEEWSGGGPTSNFGPGGWTECGRRTGCH